MRSAFRITAASCVLLTTVATALREDAGDVAHRDLAWRSAPALHTLDERTTCYDGVFIIVARGSEETQGQSILEPIASGVTAAVPNSGSNEVVYPALLSFWNSAPTGVTNAQQQMQDYYSACPTGKMVLMGYSQGSYVLSIALAGGNFSGETWAPIASDIGANVAAIVTFGNMGHVSGQGTEATGTNCATSCTASAPLALTSPYSSAMGVYSDRYENWCDDNDPVCCSTGTDIQAHLSYWSDNTTDTVVQFVQSELGSASSASSSSYSASSTSSSASWTSSSTSWTSSSTPWSSSSASSTILSTGSSTSASAASSTSSSAVSSTSSSTASSAATSADSSVSSQTPDSAAASHAPTPLGSSSATPSTSGGSRATRSLIGGSLSLCSALALLILVA